MYAASTPYEEGRLRLIAPFRRLSSHKSNKSHRGLLRGTGTCFGLQMLLMGLWGRRPLRSCAVPEAWTRALEDVAAVHFA